jgi:asparagine synthase (glutamine-hydrolysing)
LKPEKLKRWHPLHRGLYMSGRIHLPGLLLQAKGDRIAMANSVETRYPFLDERVFDFLARLHPKYKLRRLTDKWLLRKVAEKRLPASIAWRSKAMFRAPFDSFHGDNVPPFVDQLLSEAAIKRTGYFKFDAVNHWRQAYRTLHRRNFNRLSIEMGLAGVIATQLWHQTFIDNSLADLPSVKFTQREQTHKPLPV